MSNKKAVARTIALFVIGFMIVICSIISFSYAYHTTSIANNIAAYNSNMGCLSITTNTSTYYVVSASPGYFYRSTIEDVNNTNALYPATAPGFSTTDKAFGEIGFKIHNNCDRQLSLDILFVPSSENTLELINIAFSECLYPDNDWISSGGCFVPDGRVVYDNIWWLAAEWASNCYTASSTPTALYSYLASSSIGGSALGGSDPKMCSLMKANDRTSYLTVAANGTLNYVIRYWFQPDEPYDPSIDLGKVFAGKFVVYTVE